MDKRIGILARDAGGANQILSYVLNNPGNYLYSLEGPAIDIFSRSTENLRILGVEEMLSTCSTIITGTGWASTFEVEGIWLAKTKNIKVISHLDHWTKYRERFVYQKRLVLPDEIWVSDAYAKEIAANQFPQVPVVLKENFYISEILSSYSKLKDFAQPITLKDTKKILFLSEPARAYQDSTGNKTQFDEFAALKNLLNLISKEKDERIQIRIRLHPSENEYKFDEFLVNNAIEVSRNQKIEIDFAWADLVVGIDTYAMYVASYLKIPTATIALAQDYKLSIPEQGITDLRRTSFRSFINEI